MYLDSVITKKILFLNINFYTRRSVNREREEFWKWSKEESIHLNRMEENKRGKEKRYFRRGSKTIEPGDSRRTAADYSASGGGARNSYYL